jgi:Skp family chaperone for outer membrane proteins
MEKSKQLTSSLKKANILVMCMIALCLLTGSIIKANAETDGLQITANVPALDSLHESIYALWHTAYPNKDYTLIKNILPKLGISVSKLSVSALPEILHSKQAKWDNEIKNLQNDLSTLQKAAKEDNHESMLKSVESLHGSYEQLVIIIRPVLSELESFHEELYKVYHSYMPNNDIEKIKTIIPTMKMKIGLLKQAKLPQNQADRQNKFNEAVSRLETSLNELENLTKTNSKEKIKSAVDKLHSDYQSIDTLLQ